MRSEWRFILFKFDWTSFRRSRYFLLLNNGGSYDWLWLNFFNLCFNSSYLFCLYWTFYGSLLYLTSLFSFCFNFFDCWNNWGRLFYFFNLGLLLYNHFLCLLRLWYLPFNILSWLLFMLYYNFFSWSRYLFLRLQFFTFNYIFYFPFRRNLYLTFLSFRFFWDWLNFVCRFLNWIHDIFWSCRLFKVWYLQLFYSSCSFYFCLFWFLKCFLKELLIEAFLLFKIMVNGLIKIILNF